MMEKLLAVIGIERVADIALLWEQLKTMEVMRLFDKHFPPPLNGAGELTPGEVIAGWLCFILSCGNHRVSQVQAEPRLHWLAALTGKRVRALDFSDDCGAALLARLGERAVWQPFERERGSGRLRVYNLSVGIVRLDSTSAKTYAGVSEGGLLQCGHSKDHRPDLAQVKLSLARLDPLGLPVSTTVVAGNAADDPRYQPAVATARRPANAACWMAAIKRWPRWQARAFISGGGDYCRCPLGLKQCAEAERADLMAAVFARQHEPQIILRPETNEPLGGGFESTGWRTAPCTGGYRATWTERMLVFSSFERAQSAAQKLDQAIERAPREGVQLNEHKQGKKTLAVEQIVRACTEIVKRRRVAGLVNFRLETEVSERAVRAWRARPARSKSRTRPTIAAQKTTGTGLEFLCHEPPARALAAETSAPGLARAGQHRTRLWPVNRPPAWLVATVFEN